LVARRLLKRLTRKPVIMTTTTGSVVATGSKTVGDDPGHGEHCDDYHRKH
jgi:hypothetical protein